MPIQLAMSAIPGKCTNVSYPPNANIPTNTQQQVLSLVDLVPTMTVMTKAMPPASLAGESWLVATRRATTAYAQFGDMRALRSEDLLLTFRGFVHGANTLDPLVSDALAKEPRNQAHYFLHQVQTDPYQQLNIVSHDTDSFHSMLEALRTIEQDVRLSEDFQSAGQLKALRLGPGTGYW